MKKFNLTLQKPSPKQLKSSFLAQFMPTTSNHKRASHKKSSLVTPRGSLRAKSTKRSSTVRRRPAHSKPLFDSEVPNLTLTNIEIPPGKPSTSRPRRSSMTIEIQDATNILNSTLHVKSIKNSSRSKPSEPRIMTQTLLQRNTLSEDLVFPTTPAKALQVYRKELTSYEHTEILNYTTVYFLGSAAPKIKPSITEKNNGYDDERADYRIVKGDHIAYRYEVLDLLGSGSFGKVLKVKDYKTQTSLALKIIRNKRRFHQQAAVEIKVLKFLRDKDTNGDFCVIHLKEHFAFRKHICITFELLHINLYDFLQFNSFRGLSLKLVRRFATQILQALRAQEEHGIIHCDLKPENILLKHSNQSAIKVIDYGSSCFEHEKIYTYIQSRFYRAPEIMLGIEYTTKIDVWSFGCILAELYIGQPIFPGESEAEQMSCIMEVVGLPPKDVMKRATRKDLFFEEDKPVIFTNSRGRTRIPASKNITKLLEGAEGTFVNLVKACLEWDPEKRISAKEALNHEWIRGNELQNSARLQPHQRSLHPRNTSLDLDCKTNKF